MSAVALVLHFDRAQAAELAREATDWLLDQGHQVRLPVADAEVAGLHGLGVPDESLVEGLDVAVSLGGDGTMLRTVDLVAAAGVPVLGVNVGQLGYLTEVEPADLLVALDRVLAGSFTIEERMMLAVHVRAPSCGVQSGPHSGLNEAVLEKTASSSHTVRLLVTIDGDHFTPYAADGLIVATPTGSTAYSFSARGPIVSPRHRAIVLTPVSPHMLFDRPLVLAPEERLCIEVSGHRPASLSVDGRNLGVLMPGDSIECRPAPEPARLVTFEPRHFHRILKAKFGLSDR